MMDGLFGCGFGWIVKVEELVSENLDAGPEEDLPERFRLLHTDRFHPQQLQQTNERGR